MAATDQDTSVVGSEPGVVQVNGELTFRTVTAVLEQSRPLVTDAKGSLVMELGGVGRVDSAGLALLVQWMRMAREQGVDLLFRHVPVQLLDIARASDMEKILPLEES